MPPLGQRFLFGLGKSEIHRACEVLLRSVVAVCRQQLLRAQHAERIPIGRRHHVLPALAAIERQEDDPRALAARHKSQHAAVFVIRMGRKHQKAGTRIKLHQRLP